MKILHAFFIILQIVCCALGIYLFLRYFHLKEIDDWFHVNNYVCIGLAVIGIIASIIKENANKEQMFGFEYLTDLPIYAICGWILLRYILRIIWIYLCYLWQKFLNEGGMGFFMVVGFLILLFAGGGGTTYYVIKVKN